MTDKIQFTDHAYGVEIPLADLRLDEAVQRALVPGRVKKLSTNYDPSLVGEFLVSLREDGHHYILDGGHRRKAMLANGETTARCEVFQGLALADESRLFLGRNDRAAVAKNDRYRNLITEENEAALDVLNACQAAGFLFVGDADHNSTFPHFDTAKSVMQTAANQAARISAETDKPVDDNAAVAHLTRVLAFYARTWGVTDQVDRMLFVAISKVLMQKDIDEERLYDRLVGLPAELIVAGAKDDMIKAGRSKFTVHYVYERILGLYKSRRRAVAA